MNAVPPVDDVQDSQCNAVGRVRLNQRPLIVVTGVNMTTPHETYRRQKLEACSYQLLCETVECVPPNGVSDFN